MLRVVYQATSDLNPHELVEIAETRGQVTIKLRQGARPNEYIPPLNAASAELIDQCTWFQIWRGQVASVNSPGRPLTVQYEADPDVDLLSCVQIRECRGAVRFHVCPEVRAEDLVRALNPALENLLSGGQWFQLWQGEIVTMESPGSAAA